MLAIPVIVGVICFVTAVLDLDKRGTQHAVWAPVGFGLALVCGIVVLMAV